jgi:replicative superfamily II helicase
MFMHEQIQSDCFREAFCSDMNMVVSSPTGSGKTVILELAVLRMLRQHISPTGANPITLVEKLACYAVLQWQ